MMAETRQKGQRTISGSVARCSTPRKTVCAPRHTARSAVRQAIEATPIWLAALIATRCQATRAGEGATVSWKSVSGKAVYTNAGVDTEMIQPLGVALEGGQTLAVSWIPGDTAYTLEVFQ
jgi:hypothetical protein